MHVSPRRTAALLASLLIAAGAAAAPVANGTEDFALDRIAGDDRYETAAAIASVTFPTGSDAVVLRRGDAFPDALAGSFLAGVVGAPILLTMPDSIPPSTTAAIDEMGAETVYLLGGTSAISQAVEDDLKAEHTVTRLAGDDRYATATEIATSQAASGIGELADGRTAFLASGENFADALAAGPLSFAEQLPILLTRPGSLPAPTAAALEELGIEHVVVLGGTAAVSDAVVAEVTEGDITAERVAGNDRYETATEIADFALLEIAGWNNEAIDLATGTNFADALAAGPSAGDQSRSILLTNPTALSVPTRTWLEAHAGTLETGDVFGGTAAVADAVIAAAEAAGAGATGGAIDGQLTFIDKDTNFYRLVGDGAEDFETVQYAATDVFSVDGASATLGGFETNATAGDDLRYVPASGASPARHELTNVASSSFTSGTAGNVDLEDAELDFINAVSGDALRSNVGWGDSAFTVDGASASLEDFEADINEGDTVSITTSGTRTVALTNVAVEGFANDISSSPLPPSTTLKIDRLGDIAEASSDGGTDAEGQDSHFQADGNPLDSTDTFTVDGLDSDYDGFSAALSPGDQVSYERDGGVESFALVNTAPATSTGQAVDDLDPEANPLDPAGGSFTLATDDGAEAITYEAGGVFVIDGSVASETELESAYSPGDDISFRPADEASSTTQRFELTNRTLQGRVDPESTDTAEDTYGVLADNGETVLAAVVYVGEEGDNTYFVNGAAATLEAFETELDAVKAGTKSGEIERVISGSGDSSVTQHRLSTAAEA